MLQRCIFAGFIMILAILFQLLFSLERPTIVNADPPFNNPPGVDIWCGKAYRATNSSFDPGGWLFPPEPRDKQQRLDLRIYPRYSLYLSSDKKASFIIDTPVQTVAGQAFKNETWEGDIKTPFTELSLQVSNVQTNDVLVDWARIPVDSWGNEIEFDLKSMPGNLRNPWTISAIGASPDAALQTFYSGGKVTVLPERNATESVARIDYLYGGIQVQSSLTNGTWKSIYPYSFYTSWDWISSTINNASATKNLSTFRANGFNLIHPVPPGGTDPFNHTLFEQFLTICDSLELYVMYDMRHTYQNATSITSQLSRLQHHPSLLLYYTADEPDGWCDPLNATKTSYNHIKSIDPYHPISLVLNCANFYFKEYTSGTDIILEDTYPIAANTSFSTVYHTPCNTTYGDCGCDNCHSNDPAYPSYIANPFLDIVDRTENLQLYQEWLGSHDYRKPIWGVPQAFWDQGSFWGRWPSPQEEVVMGVLRLNHGAKGIVAWIYPTSEAIEDMISGIAKVVTRKDVVAYTLGTKRAFGLQVRGPEKGTVDVAAWVGESGVLVSYVVTGYENYEGDVEILIPVGVEGEVLVLWGPKDGWEIGSEGKSVKKSGLTGLEVGILEISRKVLGTD